MSDTSPNDEGSGSGGPRPFAINPSTGEITIADATVLEPGQTWKLRVMVTDSVGATAEGTVTIRLSPRVTLSAIVIPGDKTKEGQLIEAVALPWFDIIDMMIRDPDFAYDIHWRTWEEIVAGAYRRAGWDEVTLTPRSNDKGRDVIAVKRGVGALRFLVEVKAYAPDRLVRASHVRELLGVLSLDPNATKGIITTTSDFAPGVQSEFQNVIPSLLELKPQNVLIPWLASIRRGQEKAS